MSSATEDPTASGTRFLTGIFESVADALAEEGIPLTDEQRTFLMRAADRSF